MTRYTKIPPDDIGCIFLLGGETTGSSGSSDNGNRRLWRDRQKSEFIRPGPLQRERLTSFRFEPFNIFHGIRRSIKILSEAHLDDAVFCETFSQREGHISVGDLPPGLDPHFHSTTHGHIRNTLRLRLNPLKIMTLPLFHMKS